MTNKGLRLTSHVCPESRSPLRQAQGERHRRVSRLAFFVFFAFLAGCAAPQQKVDRRYFWPLPPEVPRVEFLTTYWGGGDLPKGGWQRFVESLVGSEDISLDRPLGVASNGEDKIYVTDLNAAAVVVFDTKKNTVSYLGGSEGGASFAAPVGIALDAAGNIYVSDSKKKSILVFTKDEKPLKAIAAPDIMKWPSGLAIDDSRGRLYVADSQGHDIKVFDLEGRHLFNIGKAGGGNGQFRYPNSVAVSSNGDIIVADAMNARVQVLDPDGKFIREMGRRGDGPTDLQIPKGIGVTTTGHIYVTDGRGHKVLVFDKKGNVLAAIGGKYSYTGVSSRLAPAGFLAPAGLFVDKNDTIYVVDSFNSRIQLFQELNEEYLKKRPVEGKTEEILKEISKEREAGDKDKVEGK